MLKVSPKVLCKINELWEMAKTNKTMIAMFEKLDACNKNDAYIILKNLDDNELKILAALIEQANIKFDRMTETE